MVATPNRVTRVSLKRLPWPNAAAPVATLRPTDFAVSGGALRYAVEQLCRQRPDRCFLGLRTAAGVRDPDPLLLDKLRRVIPLAEAPHLQPLSASMAALPRNVVRDRATQEPGIRFAVGDIAYLDDGSAEIAAGWFLSGSTKDVRGELLTLAGPSPPTARPRRVVVQPGTLAAGTGRRRAPHARHLGATSRCGGASARRARRQLNTPGFSRGLVPGAMPCAGASEKSGLLTAARRRISTAAK